MEDLSPDAPTPRAPMPEAGNDPGDPLAPEIEEEDNPDAPVTDPHRDVDVVGENEIDRDENDDDDDASDNESLLSDVDEAQFQDFDPAAITLEEREQIALDEDNVKLLGVHKRKRTDAEIEESRKKKEKRRRDRPSKKARRKRDGSEPFSGGDELDGKRRRRRAEGESAPRSKRNDVDESLLAPEERKRRELDRAMDEALRSGKATRAKKGEIDLEAVADEEVARIAGRMILAAKKDADSRERGEPAMAKLQMLPEVTSLLNRGGAIQQSIVDPDNDLLRAVKFFLEPTSPGGALPAYSIQKEIFAVLPRLPINADELRSGSGLGQVVMFYTRSKKPEPAIKRQAERLLSKWMSIVLKRTDDYRQRDPAAADRSTMPIRNGPQTAEDIARERALETPTFMNRARVQGGVGTYTIAPKSNMPHEGSQRAPGARSEAMFRKMQARQQGRAGGGRK